MMGTQQAADVVGVSEERPDRRPELKIGLVIGLAALGAGVLLLLNLL